MAHVTQFNYFKICKVYFWLMAPQCIEDSWAQINLYMLFNQHDFTATLLHKHHKLGLFLKHYKRNCAHYIVALYNDMYKSLRMAHEKLLMCETNLHRYAKYWHRS